MGKKETHLRSILKSVSWRILATITTIVLVYLFTKSAELAFSIGAIEIISKMIIFYFHERIWNTFKWGVN